VKKLLFLSFLFCSFSFSEDIRSPEFPHHEDQALWRWKKNPEKEPKPTDDKTIISELHGILLIGSSQSVRRIKVDEVEGVEVEDVELPAPASSLQSRLEDYFCRPVTKQDIIEIKRQIILFYRDHDRPVVHIQVPPQNVSSGVLQFIVYESKLGEIRAEGNRNFSDKKLIGAIRLKPKEPINSDTLVKDLNWINRNPFRQTDAIFTPAAQEGFTDIELVTKDQFPLRVYGGVDNTGIEQAGTFRYFAGFNWGNAFGLDHILSYQFTSGTSYNKFYAHSVHYTAPLSWRHVLVVYGGYSRVRAPLTTPGINTKGESAQASFRYEIPLPPSVSILQEFTFGFDWKWTDTNLDLDGTPFFGNFVNITQLMAGYNIGLETERTKNSITVELFWSPGRWLPHQSRSRYETLRAGANNSYLYNRVAVNSIFRLPSNFTLEPTVRWQLSTTNLLASEQFGLGGYNTVRGYEEREVNGDNMLLVNLEFRTPGVSIFECLGKLRKIRDELKFLIFLDYGYAKNHRRFFGEPQSQYLLGAGPGVRYVIHRFLTFRGDLGFKLHDLGFFSANTRKHMWYFGLVLSY